MGNGTRRNGSAAGAVLLDWACHVKRRARDSDSEVISRSPWKKRGRCCHVGQPWASRRARARGAACCPHAPIRIPVEMRQGSGAGVDEVISSGRTHRGRSLCSQSSATRRPQDFFLGPWRRAALARGSLKLCVALRTGVGCTAGCTALRDGDAMGAGSCCRAWRSWTRWGRTWPAASSWRPLGAGTRSALRAARSWHHQHVKCPIDDRVTLVSRG